MLPVPDKLFNRNFSLLCLCNLFFSMSICMTIPILPLYLTNGLGTSASMAGAFVSLYAIAALCIRPFSGCLVDRAQRRPILILCLLLFFLASTGYIFITNLLLLSLARFGHGLFFGLAGTSLNTSAVDNIPPSRLGSGVGLFGTLTSLSMALGPLCGVAIMERLSYTAVFTVSTALAAAALGISLRLRLRLPRRVIIKRPGPILKLENLFLKKANWAALSLFFSILAYGLLTNYTPLLSRQRGLESSLGMFFFCLANGLILSRLFAGRLLDKGHLLKIILVGKLIVIAAFGYFLHTGNVFSFLLSAFAFGAGYGLCAPAYQTLFISLANEQHRGVANSTNYIVWDAGIGLAALSGGLIADLTSLHFTFLLGAVLVCLSLLIFRQTTCKNYKPTSELFYK